MSETTTPNDDFWCFSWFEILSASPGRDRAGLLKRARWDVGAAIPICFLDGDKALHDRVKEAARHWVGPTMANLQFSFQKKKDALVRISFQHRGAWSAIGRTCMDIEDKKKPTMNLGGLSVSKPQEEFERIVWHEFGHLMGLVHEHQQPDGGIHWDRARVLAELKTAPYFWTEDQIKRNLFDPFSKGECNYTKFDERSIMLYPIPKQWTHNTFSSRLNMTLSETDVKSIRRWYPHE